MAELQNIRDKLVVSGDFAHFFLSAEVDGEGGGMLVQENREPVLIFCRRGPAEAGFDGNGEVSVGKGITVAIDSEVGGLNHGSAAAGFIDILVGAAEVKVDTGKAERLKGGSGGSEVLRVFTPDLSDNGGVGGGDRETL